MLLLLPGADSSEGKNARKTVRVAYQEFNRQMIVDENNTPISGYSYDYIQTIGTYAGWDIEFVPCESFADSVKMLLAGRADIIYEISYTEDRAKEMLYPDEPMGFEYYYLYASGENPSITPDDYSSLNGKTVGVTSGTMLVDLLKQWSEKKNIEFQIVEYEAIPKKEEDLHAGKIDLDLEVSMLAKPSMSAVEKVGSSAYYLVANKERPDLIDDINGAMDIILNNDLYFFTRLQERYFSDTVLSRNLTTAEKNWIANHKVLRVGYFDNYLPLSATDENGRPIGAGIDAVLEIIKRLKLEDKLKAEFICYHSQEEGYLAVEDGEIDMMLPAYISKSVKNDYRIIGGKSLMTLESDFAYIDDYGEGKDKRIGVNKTNLMQYYYSRDAYPDSEVVFYDDITGCLDGLLRGTSDGTFLNSIRAEALLKPSRYHPVRTVRAKNAFELQIAFAKDNIGLLLLMDRGLTMLDPDFINRASYSHVERIYSFSAIDFLREHILATLGVSTFLAALCVALVVYWINNRKLTRSYRKLEAYSKTIEEQKAQQSELRQQLEKANNELENTLLQAQAANHAKTVFLNNMSHDIRTPMNAIIGFTGLAASHLDDTESVRDYLNTIAQSSEHLMALINDVLDMSRIEAGKVSLQENVESLTNILHELQSIVNVDVQAKGHNFSIDTAEIKDDLVYCDKLHLNQVLLNLVSNAIKYTPPGGTISLWAGQKPSAKAGHGSFEFRCRDNGIGMGEKFLKTVFVPFAREQNSMVSGVQGTGLGLTIAKKIVEMMGGEISLTTKKGEGSEFIVSLDLRIANDAFIDQLVNSAGATFSLEGKKILLVDDNKLNLKVGVLQLEELGITVDTALNGQIAVDMIREKGVDAYDFVLMDILMPVMDGYEATAAIRKLPGGDRLKIIAYSAYAFDEDKAKSMKAGMDGHIAKPLTIAELMKVLESLFE